MTMRLPQSSVVGRRKLTGIIAGLSDRDLHLLRFLSRHRYATTTHLRDVFFHDHATPTAGTRAAVRVLHRLFRDRLVARLERPVGGYTRGSAAFIWHLTGAGERFTRPDDTPRRRFHSPSTDFLAHTLQLVDTHVTILRTARTGAFTVEQVAIETEAWRPYLTRTGTASILKPDLAVHLSTDDYDDHWYIEIDRGTESLPVLLSKCRAYAAYRATGRAQTEHGVFPRILWILPTHARAARLRTAIGEGPALDPRLFLTITSGQLGGVLSDPDGNDIRNAPPETNTLKGGTRP